MKDAWSRNGRRKGVPDGYTYQEWEELRPKILAKANKLTTLIMENVNLPDPNDEDLARQAMAVAVEIMIAPGDARNRLAAAKTVLEFTKSKPVSTTNLNVSSAESFLKDIIEYDQNYDKVGIESRTRRNPKAISE